jgi:hypothetical protein
MAIMNFQLAHVVRSERLEKFTSLWTCNPEAIHIGGVENTHRIPYSEMFFSDVCESNWHFPPCKGYNITMFFVPSK